MIEQMGGEVKVDSIYGQGTTFTININTRGKINPKNLCNLQEVYEE
jgi:chemotaxis protein histidine kinase CheA